MAVVQVSKRADPVGVEVWLKGQDSLTEAAVLELADVADEIKDELKVKANRGRV